MNKKKLFEAIDNADLGRYGLQFDETCAIIERANDDPFRTARLAFRYGFIKGRRAEKAQQAALRKEKEERL